MLTLDELSTSSDPHELEKLASDFAGQLDDQDQQTGGLLDPLTGNSLTTLFTRMDTDMNGLAHVLAAESGTPADHELGKIAGQVPGVDKLVGGAGKDLPTKTDIPVKITPPVLPPIRTRPPGEGVGPGGGITFPPPSIHPGGRVPPRPPQATIMNLTHPGNLDFQPGDKWKLYIKSRDPNTEITVKATRDGVPLATVSEGFTDDSGELIIESQFQTTDAGHWVEHWYAGGVELPSNTDFRVE